MAAFYRRLFMTLFRPAPHPFGKLDDFAFDAGVMFILLFSVWQLLKDIAKPFLTLMAIILLLCLITLCLVVALLGPIIVPLTAIPGYFQQRRQLQKMAAKL